MAASTTFVKAKTILALKLEPASGTFSAPSASDFDIKFFDIGISPEIEFHAQEFASGRHSRGRGAMGKRKITFTAKAQMLTSGAAGTPPKLGKAFEFCGLNKTTNSPVTYVPDAAKDEGVTASIVAIMVPVSGNAIVISGKGCMGNCVISMDSLGSPLVASFTFTGAFVSITDGTALALSNTADGGNAPATLGAVVTMGGGSNYQQISKFSLDFGNTIELDQDPADATGYAAAYISKRGPKLMMTPKLKRIADDYTSSSNYTRWTTGAEAAFSLATAQNSVPLKYTIAAPKAQLTANPFGNNGEEWAWSQTYELHENGTNGNDEFSIVMNT